MNIALWIIASLLAVAFVGAGGMKLVQPRQKIIASGMAWAEDVTAGTVKIIGAIEVVGALGLILPGATGVATFLTPTAAIGLALTMAGAAVVHVRRGEVTALTGPIVLGVLAIVVAILRVGPYPL